MPKNILRPFPNYFFPALLLFLAASCANTSQLLRPAPDCYRPHYTLSLDLDTLSPVVQRPFTMSTGETRLLSVYQPGPWKDSYYFIMSTAPTMQSILASPHKGVMTDTDGNGQPNCFLLGGGTLPDKRGKQVPYNYFALDINGDGIVDEFISEDIDLDHDRIMDRHSVAILMEPDPDGHFMRGAYLRKGKMTLIPKRGRDFLLDKPLWEEPFPFPDNEINKMNLIRELEKLWDEIKK